MNRRQRTITAVLWIGVAAVMAITLEPTIPTDLAGVARLFVVVLALGLAGVYLFDPWGLISRTHQVGKSGEP
ncbi:hypothetical protein [Natronosalvus halobius]|uniref:hypothetical protein n=1 Tax=Natronosalvus halobius TaxID=2953746 RepID=UPI0020A22FDC|nr:hypothetical protein [Natronosalvus halobius]USZ72345.1 hypothetical protein NGM15_03270 [Natronosalvus halobius]